MSHPYTSAEEPKNLDRKSISGTKTGSTARPQENADGTGLSGEGPDGFGPFKPRSRIGVPKPGEGPDGFGPFKPRSRIGVPKPEEEDSETGLQNIDQAIERSNFVRSVVVKRPHIYGHPTEARLSLRRHNKSVTMQVNLERKRNSLSAPPTDWRMILEMMAQNTPEESREWINHGMKIEVPEGRLALILDHAGDDKIGSIRRRTGTTLEISRDDSTVLVSGTRQAINRAIEEFRRAAGKITITRLYTPLSLGETKTEDFDDGESFYEPALSREEHAPVPRVRIKHHVNAILRPDSWTAQSVEEYVAALVDSVIVRWLHAPIYKPSKGPIYSDHERSVATRLLWLFHDNSVREIAPRSAMKLALAYLCDRGDKYLPEAREIFVLMDRRGLAMDMDVFNILLRAVVKTRDLNNFRQTMRRMLSRGLKPNLDTWILCLRMFESVEVRAHVLQTMHVKNLLSTTEAIGRVAEEMATLDAEHAMLQCKVLPTFLREQEERYGRAWLTRDAGNQVLHVLGLHGRFDDAFALLDKMSEIYVRTPEENIHDRLAVRPDVLSFNTIVARARIRGKFPLAVNVLRKMKMRDLARQPDVHTLQMLFEMAWKFRMRTSIVVLWRYACLARLASFLMRRRVAALLNGPGAVVANDFGKPTEAYRLTESTYRELGGEVLARELAGGRQALDHSRMCTQLAWGRGGYAQPQQKIAAITGKAIGLAFGDKFGPSVALGQVLAQAALVDRRCLHARTTGTLRDLLATARVKTMVLWRRRKAERSWVDLAPLETERVGPADEWVDEWESEGWEVPAREAEPGPEVNGEARVAGRDAGDGPHGDEGSPSGQAIAEEAGARTTHEPESAPASVNFAIINPHVWADDDLGQGVPGQDDGANRTEVQRQNEEAILTALERIQKKYARVRHTETGSGGDSRSDDVSSEEGEQGAEDLEYEEDGEEWAEDLEYGEDGEGDGDGGSEEHRDEGPGEEVPRGEGGDAKDP